MEKPNLLIIKILMQFYVDKDATVTKIAQTLGEQKYTVSRAINAMEEEGLINKKNTRHPVLTAYGRREAKKYTERVDTIQSHLIYEGLDPNVASRDSFYWGVYGSVETIEMIDKMSVRYRIRHEFRDKKMFTGRDLCKYLEDGSYVFPFLIYRELVKNGTNISMANAGFEHPCTIEVKDGKGQIFLHAIEMKARSQTTKKSMKGFVEDVKYFDSGNFFLARKQSTIISFPIDSMQFQTIGNYGEQQILHGSICLKMTCTVGTEHMPESTAFFTLLI